MIKIVRIVVDQLLFGAIHQSCVQAFLACFQLRLNLYLEPLNRDILLNFEALGERHLAHLSAE